MLLGAATLLSWAIQPGACWGNWTGRRGMDGIRSISACSAFYGGKRKESRWDLSKRKAAEGHSPVTCHPSVHPLLLPCPSFSGPLQFPGPWWLWRKQLRRGPALLSHLIVGDKGEGRVVRVVGQLEGR